MNHIIPKSHELINGHLASLIVRPVRPQPLCSPERFIEIGGPKGLTRPYLVGDVLGVKETWQLVEQYPTSDQTDKLPENPYASEEALAFWKRRIRYRADYHDDSHIKEHFGFTRWRSPSTMPQWAIRQYVRVTRIECRLVSSITHKEICAVLGIAYDNDWRPQPYYYGVDKTKFETAWSRAYPDSPWDTSWAWFVWTERCEKP